MKKKYLITAITCGFLIVSGILYSFNYIKDKKSLDEITTLEDTQENENFGSEENDTIDLQDATSDSEGKDSNYMDDPVKSSATKDFDAEVTAVKDAESEATDAINLPQDTASIYVHICGAVICPGVYVMKSSSRIIDVIKLAGGLSADAAGDYINQACKVSDGQRIYIPTKEETKDISVEEYGEGDPDSQVNHSSIATIDNNVDLININTADKDTLMELPGIGEAKAANIIDYRITNGKFQSVEDLMNIPGIKEGVFNKFSQYITVN